MPPTRGPRLRPGPRLGRSFAPKGMRLTDPRARVVADLGGAYLVAAPEATLVGEVYNEELAHRRLRLKPEKTRAPLALQPDRVGEPNAV